jgi:hypothetical protein
MVRSFGTNPRSQPALPVIAKVQRHTGAHLRVLLLNGLELVRIQPKSFQNRRSDLQGFDRCRDGLGLEARVRQQQHNVIVVMCETSVLSEFLGAAGVGSGDIWSNEDVRRAWIAGGRQAASHQRKRKSGLPCLLRPPSRCRPPLECSLGMIPM